ncbi:dihydroorotate dehydrogenase [Sulfobacillus harzensis]|uniref:Dihydroorotate dehydrogenase n=1 Tax=Sulfobacillus harzensis TaxID=2729629 RepID=A0A7Y0Q1F5_9FIRM|nr:dihydroorotate dehydrogenase [Sulfobacillus harzensis]
MANRLACHVAGLPLPNPVMPASGTFDYHPDVRTPVDVARLGALIPKSITLHPQPGNPPSRLAETPAGLINSIGIPSPGLAAFQDKFRSVYGGVPCPLVISVAGYSPDEYAQLTQACSRWPEVVAIELNLSCPNLKTHLMPAQDPILLRDAVQAARAATVKPLWAKLSPNVTTIAPMAAIAHDAGADAVVAINTIRAMAINIERQKAILGHFTGGLSGPAILPIGLSMVWDIAQHTSVPVIGCGGIRTVDDALMYLMAGASAVQVGTATFAHPAAMMDIINGLDRYLADQGIAQIADIIGIAKPA